MTQYLTHKKYVWSKAHIVGYKTPKGYTTKCGVNFRASKVNVISSTNKSICEKCKKSN